MASGAAFDIWSAKIGRELDEKSPNAKLSATTRIAERVYSLAQEQNDPAFNDWSFSHSPRAFSPKGVRS